MNSDTAAQFRNYGYGSVPQRGGGHHGHPGSAGRGGHHPAHLGGPFPHGAQQQHGLPHSPYTAQSPPPPPPSASGPPGPPAPGMPPGQHSNSDPPAAKRPRYESLQAQPMAQPMQQPQFPGQPGQSGPPYHQQQHQHQAYPTYGQPPHQLQQQRIYQQQGFSQTSTVLQNHLPQAPHLMQAASSNGQAYQPNAMPMRQATPVQPSLHQPYGPSQQSPNYPQPPLHFQQQQQPPRLPHNSQSVLPGPPPPHQSIPVTAAKAPLPPPLALAPMKPAAYRPPKPSTPAAPPPPPPPPSSAPPPPPPPPPTGPAGLPAPPLSRGKHTSGTIKLDSRGAATLPPTPVGSAVFPSGPSSVSAGASNPQSASEGSPINASVRRDTRGPIPSGPSSQSRLPDHRARDREREFPAGPSASRGGFAPRGRGSARGGRGGFDSHPRDARQGGLGSRRGGPPIHPANNNISRVFRNTEDGSENHNHRAGGKRSFSQTGPGPSQYQQQRARRPSPSPSNLSVSSSRDHIGPGMQRRRARADSNATVTSTSHEASGPGKGQRDRDRDAPALRKKNRQDLEGTGNARSAGPAARGPAGNEGLKKTLTDFRIESLEIRELGWLWKAKTVTEAEVTEQPSGSGMQAPGMERKDSRKEKRKHSEEDDVGGEASENGDEPVPEDGDHPRRRSHDRDDEETDEQRNRHGKKARNDSGPDVHDSSLGTETNGDIRVAPSGSEEEEPGGAGQNDDGEEHAQDSPRRPILTVTASQDEESPADQDDSCADLPPIASPVPRRASISASASVSGDEASNSDAEIAAAVIARPSSSPGRLPSVEPELLPPVGASTGEQNHQDKTGDASSSRKMPSIARTLPVAGQSSQARERPAGPPAATKKARENSRLRIYFCSPVALESKEGRKHLLARSTRAPSPSPIIKQDVANKRLKRARQETPALEPESDVREKREESVDTTITQDLREQSLDVSEEDTSAPEKNEGPADPQGTEGEPANEGVNQEGEDDVDVDGEPIVEAVGPGSDEEQDAVDGAASKSEQGSSELKVGDADSRTIDAASQAAHVASAEASTDRSPRQVSEKGPETVDRETLQKPEQPSPDRISISYASNTRRLVVDAEVVQEVVIYRTEAKVEIKVRLEPVRKGEASTLAGSGDESAVQVCRGVHLESLKKGSEYTQVDIKTLQEAWPVQGPNDPGEGSQWSGSGSGSSGTLVPAHPDQMAGLAHVTEEQQLLPPLHHLLAPTALSPLSATTTTITTSGSLAEDRSDNIGQGEVVASGPEQPQGPSLPSPSAASPPDSPEEARAQEERNGAADEGGRLFQHESMTIVARLDRESPLTEAKWVRTGHVDEWLLSVSTHTHLPTGPSSSFLRPAPGPGPSHPLPQGKHLPPWPLSSPSASASAHSKSSEAGGAGVSGWKGKIRVVDPDAPPTFQHALENWLSTATSRSVFDSARYEFVRTHFREVENIVEVLLRVIRGGGGAAPSGPSGANTHGYGHGHHGSSSLGTQGAASGAASMAGMRYPEHQTHTTVVTYQLIMMGLEALLLQPRHDNDGSTDGEEDGLDKRREEVCRRVGTVVRGLPYSAIFKALDAMFAEYKRTLPRD